MLTIGIKTKIIRKAIRRIFADAKRSKKDKTFCLSEVDAICGFANDCSRDALIWCKKSQDVKLDVANLGITATGSLGMALVERNRKGPWPADWIARSGRPDANFLLGTMILSLNRSAMSAIHLCLIGQDFSARLIIRHVIELSWLILVLSDDQAMMRIHNSARSHKKIMQNWREYFTAPKLNAAVSKLEEKMGFNKINRDWFHNDRRRSYRYYSNSVHNAPIFSVVSAYVFSEKETLIPAPFGGASPFSTPAQIDVLIDQLLYFHGMFWKILKTQRKFILPNSRMLWRSADRLKLCFFAAMDEVDALPESATKRRA